MTIKFHVISFYIFDITIKSSARHNDYYFTERDSETH